MPDIPVGTITFLFTDIEGSTRLWEEYPEAMHTALARHDAALHDTISRHGGYIFKRLGDAFCAAFDSASEAVAAAVKIQTLLSQIVWAETGPLRVRIALHTGAAEERDGDYFGTPLNRVARLRAAAHGGQSLVSQATAELVRDALPEGAQLRDLGVHRLKDLQTPERIYQLTYPDLPSDFPPLLSLDQLPNNLPHQLTSFVGREQEAEDIRQLVLSTRLVTLTGVGGCGKTRLAVQVAADLLEAFPDGVWLVDLATVTDPALVPQATATVLELPEEPGKALRDTLTDHLHSRTLLLLLDNCEHLLSTVAPFTHHLLQSCPKLRILATGREALGVPGETAWRVPSMALPDPGASPTVEELARFEAVRLFMERVTAIQPNFTLTEQNAPFVQQICQRLDGLPLAIELAAARARVLSVEQLAARLDDRFRLLTGGSRTALPRQQTLRALIDWSYDLLSDPEKTLFRRLSVFSGGWSREAAEFVCADFRLPHSSDTQNTDLVPGENSSEHRTSNMEHEDVADLLTALVEKSLVIADEQGKVLRYRLLETIRQYSRDRLVEAGEADAVRAKHCEFYRLRAEQAYTPLAAGDLEWLRRIAVDYDNFRSALTWCADHEEGAASGLKIAGALLWYWFGRGEYTEGREHLERALQRGTDAPPALRGRALNGAGAMAHGMGDYERAVDYHAQALAIFRALDEKREVAFSLAGLGAQQVCLCRFEEARATLEEGLTLARELGDRWVMGLLLLNLAEAVWHLGEKAIAEALCMECLLIGRETGNILWTAYAYNGLGATATHRGDYHRARELYANALHLFREVGDLRNAAYSLEGLARIAVLEIQYIRAARLFGAAEALREIIHSPWTPPDRLEYTPYLDRLHEAFPEETLAAEWTQGRALNLEQATTYALGMAGE